MVCVVEYGDNIGTLKNLFADLKQARIFVQRLIDLSAGKYESIGEYQWYCPETAEYVKIEDIECR
jgi:hypothetical protein